MIDLAKFVASKRHDQRPPIVDELDDAESFEFHECLAHGRRTGAESFGQSEYDESSLGGQVTFEYRMEEPSDDFLAQPRPRGWFGRR